MERFYEFDEMKFAHQNKLKNQFSPINLFALYNSPLDRMSCLGKELVDLIGNFKNCDQFQF